MTHNLLTFGLHAGILTFGVGRSAGILADVNDFAFAVLLFRHCFTQQTLFLVFQCVACDTMHLCLIFESTHSVQHFRSGHVDGLCNCTMNFITSCLPIFLSCPVKACLLEVQSRTALLMPLNMLLCQCIPIVVSVCFLCEVAGTSPGSD